jgi:hypothetical protein
MVERYLAGGRCGMRVLCVVMAGAVLLGADVGRVSGGEPMRQINQPPPPRGAGFPGTGRAAGEDNSMSADIAQRQAQARNIERQKRLVADTEKLLALATDLKQEVDKTNKDVMSVEVIKKAEEIEKLARSVKERMKG